MNCLGYKLRRTFRLWDCVTIIGACVLLTAPCIGAIFYLEEWTAPAGTLIAVPALAWLIAVLMFRARWQFWAPVEYVTPQGLAVWQFDPDAVLKWESAVRRSGARHRQGESESLVPWIHEQDAVSVIVEAVIKFWCESPGSSLPSALRRVSRLSGKNVESGDVEARRILRKAVLLWRQQPFKTTHWRWRDRWLSGLRKGERMEVGWRPCPWDTALGWELSGVFVNLIAGIWGEAKANAAIDGAGYDTYKIR